MHKKPIYSKISARVTRQSLIVRVESFTLVWISMICLGTFGHLFGLLGGASQEPQTHKIPIPPQ